MTTPQDYKTARALALETLSKSDITTCCLRAGVSLRRISSHEQTIDIPFLNQTFFLVLKEAESRFDESRGPIKLADQVLLLHYLITASGKPVRETWITFREVPSGPFYYPSFVKRAIVPLVGCFGEKPEGLLGVAKDWGAPVSGPGDAALKVMALPRVPVVLSLWRGDDEFPPEGNVYFDMSVSSYLNTEDIAYLAGSVVYHTIGLFRKMR